MDENVEGQLSPGGADSHVSRRHLFGLSAFAAAAGLVGLDLIAGPTQRAVAATDTLYWPTVSMAVSAGGDYGADRGPDHTPRYHQGVDISIPVGTTLYGSGNGTVTTIANTGTSAGYGLYVLVTYGNVTVITAHMSSVSVSVGQTVTTSTVLGLSGGAPGSFGAGDATGPHCHVEVRVGGTLTDPHQILSDRSLIGRTPPAPTNGDEDVRIIRSPNRGASVIGPGYFKPLTGEELPYAIALYGNVIDGNDREFDLYRSIATNGTMSKSA